FCPFAPWSASWVITRCLEHESCEPIGHDCNIDVVWRQVRLPFHDAVGALRARQDSECAHSQDVKTAGLFTGTFAERRYALRNAMGSAAKKDMTPTGRRLPSGRLRQRSKAYL